MMMTDEQAVGEVKAGGSVTVSRGYVFPARDQLFLLPVCMRDWLEEGHLAWFVLDVVAQMDTSGLHARGAGNQPSDPLRVDSGRGVTEIQSESAGGRPRGARARSGGPDDRSDHAHQTSVSLSLTSAPLLLSIAICAAYYPGPEARHGQTLGKRFWGSASSTSTAKPQPPALFWSARSVGSSTATSSG